MVQVIVTSSHLSCLCVVPDLVDVIVKFTHLMLLSRSLWHHSQIHLHCAVVQVIVTSSHPSCVKPYRDDITVELTSLVFCFCVFLKPGNDEIINEDNELEMAYKTQKDLNRWVVMCCPCSFTCPVWFWLLPLIWSVTCLFVGVNGCLVDGFISRQSVCRLECSLDACKPLICPCSVWSKTVEWPSVRAKPAVVL